MLAYTLFDRTGFTLTELMLVMGLAAVVAGIAVPVTRHATDGMRLDMAAREVERQLQTARLRSVSTNRALILRLNCPAAGQIRVVEVTGVQATDGDGNRCDETRFPFPGPRDTDRATPAHDGPVRRLHSSIAVSGSDIQFSPDGTTQELDGSDARPISTPVGLTVTRDSESTTVTVNGLGKIDIQ